MSKYEVNFKRFALLMLPTFWRRPILATIAYAMVSPLSYLHTRFTLFRREKIYRLTHNGQVCHLQAVLNDQFDPVSRRVTLSEPTGHRVGTLLYLRSQYREERVPCRTCGAVMLNRRGYGGVNGYDFWVNIPQELCEGDNIERVKGVVAIYKLASKRFAINSIP